MQTKISVLLGVIIIILSYVVFSSPTQLGGITADAPTYTNATNTFKDCTTTTSTAVAATSTNRLAFIASASSSLTLCQSASCLDGQGILLNAGERFIQDDGYIGPYSCVGRGSTTARVGVVSK